MSVEKFKISSKTKMYNRQNILLTLNFILKSTHAITNQKKNIQLL